VRHRSVEVKGGARAQNRQRLNVAKPLHVAVNPVHGMHRCERAMACGWHGYGSFWAPEEMDKNPILFVPEPTTGRTFCGYMHAFVIFASSGFLTIARDTGTI
jgi:hypothetical protein